MNDHLITAADVGAIIATVLVLAFVALRDPR